MLEYAELLVTREGRLYCAAHRDVTHLAIHPWQDLQTIVSCFASIGTNSTLYTAALGGDDVDFSNYSSAIAVADNLIRDLKAILHGNGLGKFQGTPTCASWFSGPPASPGASSRASNASSGQEQGPKRQKVDPAKHEYQKAQGIFRFDPAVAGTKRLPMLKVYEKKKGAKIAERLCTQFLTQGYVCPHGASCKFPHINNAMDSLPAPDRKKLADSVKKEPGLSWAPGHAPPGTD